MKRAKKIFQALFYPRCDYCKKILTKDDHIHAMTGGGECRACMRKKLGVDK